MSDELTQEDLNYVHDTLQKLSDEFYGKGVLTDFTSSTEHIQLTIGAMMDVVDNRNRLMFSEHNPKYNQAEYREEGRRFIALYDKNDALEYDLPWENVREEEGVRENA